MNTTTCKHPYRLRSRINRRPYHDPKSGDRGYIADVLCKGCGEILRRDEKTCTNFFRNSLWQRR